MQLTFKGLVINLAIAGIIFKAGYDYGKSKVVVECAKAVINNANKEESNGDN